jgi:hypothetical protein
VCSGAPGRPGAPVRLVPELRFTVPQGPKYLGLKSGLDHPTKAPLSHETLTRSGAPKGGQWSDSRLILRVSIVLCGLKYIVVRDTRSWQLIIHRALQVLCNECGSVRSGKITVHPVLKTGLVNFVLLQLRLTVVCSEEALCQRVSLLLV